MTWAGAGMRMVVAGSTGALFVSALVAQTAFADPSRCLSGRPTIEIVDGALHGEGVARCNVSSLRYFAGEIKWDKNFAADPLVAKETMRAYSSYFMEIDSCDKGNTRKYYSRTYFTSTPGHHHDSTYKVLKAC